MTTTPSVFYNRESALSRIAAGNDAALAIARMFERLGDEDKEWPRVNLLYSLAVYCDLFNLRGQKLVDDYHVRSGGRDFMSYVDYVHDPDKWA